MDNLLSPDEELKLKGMTKRIEIARQAGDIDAVNRIETEIALLKNGRTRRLEGIGDIVIPDFQITIGVQPKGFNEWAKTKK